MSDFIYIFNKLLLNVGTYIYAHFDDKSHEMLVGDAVHSVPQVDSSDSYVFNRIARRKAGRCGQRPLQGITVVHIYHEPSALSERVCKRYI